MKTLKHWHLFAAVLFGAACSDLVMKATDSVFDSAIDTAVSTAKAADPDPECEVYEVKAYRMGSSSDLYSWEGSLPEGWVPFSNEGNIIWAQRCSS